MVNISTQAASIQVFSIIIYPNEETLQAYLSENEVPLRFLSSFGRSAGVAVFFIQTLQNFQDLW